MNMIEAVKSVFSQYANFSGRTRRSEYWYFTLFNGIVSGVLSALGNYSNLFTIIAGVYSLAVIIPSLAVIWRRLHDTGKSGLYYLFILIPIVGVILLLVWFCKDSGPDNQYGPNPKRSPMDNLNTYNY